MPEVFADAERCESYGNCVIAAPDVFDLDDEGTVVLLRSEVPESDRDRVQQAVRLCPIKVLRISEKVD